MPVEWDKLAKWLIALLLLLFVIFAYLNFLDAGFYCSKYCECQFGENISWKYEPGNCMCQNTSAPGDLFRFPNVS